MLDALYPCPCVACDHPNGGPLCDACERSLALRPRALKSPSLQAVWVLTAYTSHVGDAVARAKISGDRRPLRVLGRAMADAARPWGAAWFDAIVPCPSPARRRARRGFGPGHVLAAAISESWGVPLRSSLAVAGGRRQSRLGAGDRAANLAARLRLRQPPFGRVLLVDDVVTTGATLTTCADLLAAAPSVEGVWALALCDVARRVPPRVVTTSRTTAEAL